MQSKIRAKNTQSVNLICWVIFLTIITLILAIPIPVAAAPQSRLLEVAELSEAGTYLFSVGWDQGTLTAVLVAPDGTRSTPEKPAQGVAVARREKIIIYKISYASPGIWKMEFTDDNNGRVGVVVQRLIKPVQVENIVVSQYGDNSINAQFTINGEKNTSFSYDAYLSLDGNMGGSKHLGAGQAQAGQPVTVDYQLNDIGSYDQYYLVIEAKSTQEGFTDFDVAVSDPFLYINPSAPAAVRLLKAISFPEGIEISWEAPAGAVPEGYVISAFDGGKLPYHAITVDGKSMFAVIPADGLKKITIQVAAIRDGLAGRASLITVDRSVTLTSQLNCQLPENGFLTAGVVDVPYAVSAPQMVSVMINDNRFVEEIDGEGKLHLNLAQGTNNLRIMVRIDESHAVGEIRSWSADLLPPMLRIYNDPDGQVTQDSVWKIAGNSDGATTVRVNGQTVESDQFSNFSTNISLAIGSNPLEVIVIDSAGNQAAYAASITRVDELAAQSWMKSPWAIASLILLVLAIGLFIAAWRLKKLNVLVAVSLAVLLVLSSVSTGIGVVKLMRSNKSSKPLTDYEIMARAAVQSNLGTQAFDLANKALRQDAGKPELILLAARAAVLTGDLPAADHYYQQVLGLTEEDRLQLVNPGSALSEAQDWSAAANLADQQQKYAIRNLAAGILANSQSDNMKIKSVAPVVEDLSKLTDAQNSLSQLQSGSSSDGSAIWTELENDLADLVSGLFGQEACDLLAESYQTREDWPSLIETLPDLADAGLISLAGLVLDGEISQEAVTETTGQTWDIFVTDLAKKLVSAAHANHPEAALLNTLAAWLCLSELGDPDQAEKLLQQALQQFDPLVGTSDPAVNHFLMLLQVLQSGSGSSLLNGEPDLRQLADELTYGHLSGQTEPVETEPSETTGETTTEPFKWPDGLDGDQVRDDLQAFLNISAPEMTEAGRIRLMVTMAQASQGFPGGIPSAADFEFRSNIGFRRLFTVNSLTEISDAPRYTMLLIDGRPFIPAETLELERQAALAYVQTKPADEKVVVVLGGLPDQGLRSVCSDGLVELFGNSEMECYLPTADREQLESFINAQYTGDLFSSPDLFQMIAYPLSRMTAVDPRQVSDDWTTTSLADLLPWFGQVIVLTNGDPDGGVSAGGEKTIDYIRGAAINANAAIHIVGINPVVPDSDLRQLAEAGRGSYIAASNDDLMAFYDFIRTREIKIFLADCQFPENPQDSFADIWARHIPTSVIAGFRRNPGAGADLIGTAHYSDAGLSESDFSDYSGDYTDPDDPSGDQEGYNPGLNPGGDPFADPGDTGQTGDAGEDLLDVDLGSLAVFGPDRQTIARGLGGLVLITLNGQGFTGLSPGDVNITIVDAGRIASSFIDITSDSAIRFFLPATLPAGQYSLQVTIGGSSFLFADTFLIYDVNGVTTLDFRRMDAGSCQHAAG